jgi:predicted O-methyltransferase YrrM
MLHSLDRIARQARLKTLNRSARRSGPAFVNAVLLATKRKPITAATYEAWLADLRSQAGLADAYARARSQILAYGGPEAKLPGDYAARLAAVPGMIDLFYMLPRALEPERVVETGVAFGSSSGLILAALAANGRGTLTSIDLPDIGGMDGTMGKDGVGVLVPDDLRPRWTLIRGNALVELPRVLSEAPPDLFSHDSDHSYAHMAFEYAAALQTMRPGSVIVSDDTLMNSAFYDVVVPHARGFATHTTNQTLAAAVL